MSDKGLQDWISSGDALTLIIARTGSEEAATRFLNQWFLDGGLKARAKAYAEQINFGPLPKQIPASVSDQTTSVRIFPEGKYGALTLSSQKNDRDAKSPSLLADWKAGSFALVDPPIPVLIRAKADGQVTSPVGKRFVFFNVELLREEVHKLSLAIPPLTRRTSGRSGPRIKQWNLAQLLRALESDILNDKMQRFGSIEVRGAQAAIVKHIQLMATGKNGVRPSLGTCRRKGKALFEQWQKHVAENDK